MTVTLELEPEVESRVRSKARSAGKSVENILMKAIDEKFPEPPSERPFHETASREKWLAELYSLAEFSDQIPLTWNDSRESIYGPREDAQL